jgi:ferredoxin
MAYKIEFDREKCRGCGACTQCDNWEMDNKGKAYPIKTELKELDCNGDAADICPVRAIKIVKA